MPPEDSGLPSQSPEPQSPLAQSEQRAAEAARGFQLATNAYALDQLDIRDPSRPAATEAAPLLRAPPGVPAGRGPVPGASAEAPAFTDDQLRRAAEVGLGADDARSFGDPAALERTIGLIHRQRAAQPPPPWQPPPEGEPADELPSLRAAVWPAGSKDEFGRDIGGTPFFDDRLVGAVEARDEHFRGVIARQQQAIDELQQQFGQVRQTSEQARNQQIDRQFEEAFAAAAGEHEAVLGRGTFHEVGQGSPAGLARVRVVKTTAALEQSLGVPFAAAFDMALRAVCGAGRPAAPGAAGPEPRFNAAPARDPGTGRFLAPPTQSRNGSGARPPSQEQREAMALRNLEARGRAAGLFGS